MICKVKSPEMKCWTNDVQNQSLKMIVHKMAYQKSLLWSYKKIFDLKKRKNSYKDILNVNCNLI